MSGGFFIATGSSGMAQTIGNTSTQYGVLIKLRTAQNANNLIHIEDTNGDEIFTFKPIKKYQSIAFSSPILQKNSSYKLYLGGSSTANENNGLYEDCVYSDGILTSTFTISNIVTTIQQ